MSEKLREEWKELATKWKKVFETLKGIKDEKSRVQIYALADETLELAKKDELSKQITSLVFISMFLKSMKDPNVWNEWMASEASWWRDPTKIKMRLNAIKKKE